jgi:galactan 5-O-arabinofuranosyltransferase
MLKLGVIGVAFFAPLASYLMWRRVVEPRTAAVVSIATVPLVTTALIEPYNWIALLVFVPWWLQVGHGLSRPGRPRPNMIVLGLIGSVLFSLYYYYFYLIPIVLLLQVIDARWRGELSWRELRRTIAVLGIAAFGSSVFWAPLAWNFLTAPAFESLNNRWMTLNSGDLALPMLEPSVLGVLCLAGLVFLVVTAKERLSRALLLVLVSSYVWHAVGFLANAVNMPLMSFRMRDLVEPLLLSAVALGLVRLARLAAVAAPSGLFPAGTLVRLVAVGGIVLSVFVGDQYVNGVLGKPVVQAAHNQQLPDGELPPYHDASAKTQAAATRLAAIIDSEYTGRGHPVVLTDRSDLMAYYPYYGFVQWNAGYSHPTSRYHDRLAFLEDLAHSRTTGEFAQRSGANPYDRIDAIVLAVQKNSLVFKSHDDAFPLGTKIREIDTPKSLISPEYFQVSLVGGYLVAVRR